MTLMKPGGRTHSNFDELNVLIGVSYIYNIMDRKEDHKLLAERVISDS
jgi:hypothetical protein